MKLIELSNRRHSSARIMVFSKVGKLFHEVIPQFHDSTYTLRDVGL